MTMNIRPSWLTYVEDDGDPRVTEPAGAPCVTGENCLLLARARNAGRQYLDGDLTVEDQVAAAPYLACPAVPPAGFPGGTLPASSVPDSMKPAHSRLAAPAEGHARNGVVRRYRTACYARTCKPRCLSRVSAACRSGQGGCPGSRS